MVLVLIPSLAIRMGIRILLADDHGVLRQDLTSLLNKQPDVEVVAEAGNGRKALELVGELAPDIVIMDITMPDLNGIDATMRITSEFPETKVIALSIHSNRRFITNMLKAGAVGYVLKDCMFEELIRSIRAVTDGGVYLSPGIISDVVDEGIGL